MHVTVLTIFPGLFGDFMTTSLVGKAVADGRLRIEVRDLREFTDDRHQTVDDEPFGGGGGMVMKAIPWIRAVRNLADARRTRRILMSPQGPRLTDVKVRELAKYPHLLLMCGRYEGIDERVRDLVVDEEVSIGDYVLSGGELPAMVLIEALSRQVPGVVGRSESVEADSFRSGLLDFPQYTRPRVVEGLEVPAVLLSGDHEAIRRWREEQALAATLRKRPDLVSRSELSEAQKKLLAGLEDGPVDS